MEPKDFIQQLRQQAKDAIARGEQIDFFHAFVTSRPSGEQCIYWMYPEIIRLRALVQTIQGGITEANAYPETVEWLNQVISDSWEKGGTHDQALGTHRNE